MTIFSGLSKLDKTYQYLLIMLGFSLPLSVALYNLALFTILILWVFEGNFASKFNTIKNNKVVISVVFFVLLQAFGLLWTDNIDRGLDIFKKEYKLLFIIILTTVVKKEFIKYYIGAFLLAMLISVLTSYLIYFNIINAFGHASATDPTAFMTHIFYNPILALAIYLMLYQVIIKTTPSKTLNIFYWILLILMVFSMFITGGRAGQVAFFVLLSLFIFQYFKTKYIKAFFVALFSSLLVISVMYNTLESFKDRVNITISNSQSYNDNVNTSVGLRVAFVQNTFDIFMDNPFFGVGTGSVGDFKGKINPQNGISYDESVINPHNMYMYEAFQLGMLGLISLLSIMWFQVRYALKSSNILTKYAGLALPILFIVIMFSEIYLYARVVMIMFVFFSAFLYKDYAKD